MSKKAPKRIKVQCNVRPCELFVYEQTDLSEHHRALQNVDASSKIGEAIADEIGAAMSWFAANMLGYDFEAQEVNEDFECLVSVHSPYLLAYSDDPPCQDPLCIDIGCEEVGVVRRISLEDILIPDFYQGGSAKLFATAEALEKLASSIKKRASRCQDEGA